MRYRTVVFLAFLATATSSLVEGNQDDKVKQEIQRLEGTWKVTSLKLFGEETKDKKDREAEYVFKGDKLLIKMKGDDENKLQTFRLDLTKNPRHFDLDGIEGTAKGVYLLQGDTLTICLPFPFVSKDRPVRFEADREGKAGLMVLKRIK